MKKRLFAKLLLAASFCLGALTACTFKGEKGEKGEQGSNGLNGSNGKDGLDGKDGDDGKDGTSVLTGNGTPSSTLGKDGDSYIDLSTWDCYLKKEGEWLKTGNIKGTNGKDGENGKDGDDGVSVVSIEKTSSDGGRDTYTITYSDGTESTFTVTNGEDGEQGIQGEKGDDGHTPSITIGENGNWYVDGVDSGVSSKGERGNDGEKGDKGEDGVSIVNAYVDENGHLICEMSDGTKKDAGEIKNSSLHKVDFYFSFSEELMGTVYVVDGSKLSVPNSVKDKIAGFEVAYWVAFDDEEWVDHYGMFDGYACPWSFSGYPVTSDLSLYGITYYFKQYKITYSLNGGKNASDNASSYNVTSEFTLSDPTRDGYTFCGWYTDESCVNKIEKISKWTTGDLHLWAKWLGNINALSVISEDVSMGTVEILFGEGRSGETIALKATPVDGYALKGWYIDENLVSADETYSFTMPARSRTLKAKFWTVEEEKEKRKSKYMIPEYNPESGTITYGIYPQSYVSDESLITSLNELTTSESNGWFLYEGSYFAKKTANPCSSRYTFGDGATIVNGTEYWFKCEPIEWNVLSFSDGVYSLVSSMLLDAHCYNSSSKRTIDGKTIYSNNYEYSDIRSWLNGEFYSSAFALDDSLIQTVIVDNSAATTETSTNKYVCSDTEDKVYLLSCQDYFNSNYFPIVCKPTDWAKANGAYYRYDTYTPYTGNGFYWTRSPSNLNEWRADYLDIDGCTLGYVYTVDSALICVRPGLQIKEE